MLIYWFLSRIKSFKNDAHSCSGIFRYEFSCFFMTYGNMEAEFHIHHKASKALGASISHIWTCVLFFIKIFGDWWILLHKTSFVEIALRIMPPDI